MFGAGVYWKFRWWICWDIDLDPFFPVKVMILLVGFKNGVMLKVLRMLEV